MAHRLFTDDEFLADAPDPEATVFRSEVTTAHSRGYANDPTGRALGHQPNVPSREPYNDFQLTQPFTHLGGGVASRYGFNPALGGAFPSAGSDDDNGLRAGQATLRNLMKAQKAYAMNLATRDPQAAGMAFADLDGMREGFQSLVNDGWNGRDAAHVVGAVGRVFGGYGNATENARQLKRYADTRGVDLITAGNELGSLQKNFAAGYLTDYGFTGKVTPDSAHYENIRDSFTDLLSALWKVEDQYNWQFNQATYRDVFNRCRGIAADLALAGLSVKGVGAEAIVRAALKENGSLNDDAMLSAPVTQLMQSRARDRALISLAPGFTADTASNPFSAASAGATAKERAVQAADDQDFGLVRSLRQALFRHRARSVNAGLRGGADDFSDRSTLRKEFANAFRMFSTGSARVDDDTFLKLADGVIGRIAAGEATSVVEAVKGLVDDRKVDEAQADALATWTRSLMMDTAEGDRMLRETAYPFIEEIAMQAGVSMRDPAIAPFVARAYSLVRRTLLDRRVVADLDGLGDEVSDEMLWKDVRDRLAPMTERLRLAARHKNEQAQLQAQAIAEARQRAKEEGN